MDLFEYQARDVLASHGVPVLPGGVAETPEQAEAIAREIAAPVVVKAQVKVGGRGKAGGVKLADNPEDAKARAQDILGLDIKGHITHKVMVAQAAGDSAANPPQVSAAVSRTVVARRTGGSSSSRWGERAGPGSVRGPME